MCINYAFVMCLLDLACILPALQSQQQKYARVYGLNKNYPDNRPN